MCMSFFSAKYTALEVVKNVPSNLWSLDLFWVLKVKIGSLTVLEIQLGN